MQFKSKSYCVFRVINGIVLTILTLICLLPLLHVLALSLSDAVAANSNSVHFFPKGLNFSAYKLIFSNHAFLHAFGVSVLRTVTGCGLALAMVILTAYPLSSQDKDLKGRKVITWYFVLPMLISGGLVPTYITIKQLGLIDNFLVYILPGCVPTYYVILMMNFFQGISRSLRESASIDGADEFTILLRIMLPLSLPSIATIALFSAVGHWNEWFNAMIYMNGQELWPLQTLMRSMLLRIEETLFDAGEIAELSKLSSKSFQAAQVIFAIVPIMCVYPFLQRYFISGMTLGSVKE